jgi:hypothetical protein
LTRLMCAHLLMCSWLPFQLLNSSVAVVTARHATGCCVFRSNVISTFRI